MSLADHVHQLVSEHMTMTKTGEFVKTPPLLAQLRAAVTSDFAVGRGGSGGAGMILNSKADKLERDIKEKILNEQFEMTGIEYRGGIVTLLRAWEIAASSEWRDYLERVTLEWIDNIRALLEARRPPYRPSLPCPSCGQRFYGPEREPCLAVYHWDDDAEQTAHPSQWIAKCEGCGAEWSGDNLKWLRAAADTPGVEFARVS